MPLYTGSCHCGAVKFQIDAEIMELTQCDCSLCTKKNALMCAVPERAFTLLAGEDVLTLYQWNTRIARHYFCGVCGIYTFHRKRSAPDQFGINVRCLDEFDAAVVPLRQAVGRSMSVVADNPRHEWKGPRE